MPTAPPGGFAAAAVQSDPLAALADRCVQCGLCLPACPTYGHDRLEAESPRGRIALARAWALDTIPATAASDTHLDHCLGCRSCEAVCPAGVEYGRLLVAARSRQRERRPAGWRQRLVERLAARPRARRGPGRLPRRLPVAAGRRATVAAAARPVRALPRRAGASTARVSLFVGCVAGAYEAPLRARWRGCAAASASSSTSLRTKAAAAPCMSTPAIPPPRPRWRRAIAPPSPAAAPC
nr:4Fe-4S dicluster domain-containing protein [Lysobacter enzymogenes]